MSIDGFIPQIWTARLLAALQKALVFGQSNVVNRDYEGEISAKGDTVNIGGIGAITVKAYTKNTDIDAPEDLADDMTALVIDQADYFNFQVDDIDARQAATRLVDAAMTDAAYRMRDKADRFIALQIIADGTAANTTATDPYVQLVELGVQLDEADVPTSGRYAVVPPAFHGLLLQDDRFVASGALPADQRLLNGQIGEAAGFAILKSNNARGVDDPGPPITPTPHVIAGHPMAVSYAEQINKVEAFRPEARFADAVKGLHLYGAKVVRPAAVLYLPL
jgi:hypothetical protein